MHEDPRRAVAEVRKIEKKSGAIEPVNNSPKAYPNLQLLSAAASLG
jgi:hypothetical protein